MGAYHANTRDILFNLFTAPQPIRPFGQGPWSDFDPDTVKTIIEEVARLAEGPVHDSFTIADTDHPHFDPDTHTVTLPEPLKDSYKTLMDAEWWRLDLPEELGGSNAPAMLRWSCAEMLLAANPAIFLYMAGPLFAAILQELGTPDQQRLAQLMVDHQWGATMVLTEPDAGSDVGAGRTKATLQPDGTWHIEGVKRFITSGDHDLSDNIIHFVLARPTGIEGLGGAGTKGLSLFIVPKYHIDLHTGELGDRNGAYVTNVENKMGLSASATCELTFGQHGTPAVGWLVGDRHSGIADMFRIIEWARMMVGTKAMATLGFGYQQSLDYAKTRVQGPDLARMLDKTSPRVPIINHPDVRRMLMDQKVHSEGLRALVTYTAGWQDRVTAAATQPDPDGLTPHDLHAINDLLLPIVKGYGSERAIEMLNLSLQVLGGSGYLKDYPIERLIRDARIDALYEGTTGIQAMDFTFRKILKDQMSAWNRINATISATMSDGHPNLTAERAAIKTAAGHVNSMLEQIINWSLTSLNTPDTIYKVGENNVRFLMAAGDLIVGWLLVRHAELAQTLIDAGDNDPYYTGKVDSAAYFTRTVLPRLVSDLAIITSTDGSLMDIPEEAF